MLQVEYSAAGRGVLEARPLIVVKGLTGKAMMVRERDGRRGGH